MSLRFAVAPLPFLAALLTAASPAAAQAPSPGAPSAAAAPATAADEALAIVLGQAISEDEVDALIAPQLAEMKQKAYELRSQALDELIARRLVEAEAARRGMTLEALIKEEVEAKVVTTEADKKALYEANKSRFSGMTEAEAMKQVEPALRQQKRRERQLAYVRELRQRAGVEVRLEPLRASVQVPEGAPRRGPEKAPVTIVEFSDFQCPFCVRAQPTLRRVRETYGDKVRFVFLDFPLDMHPQARKAHEAAACAADQGKFWPMYDRLFASQGKLEVADLKGYAAELGLVPADFAACLDSGRHAAATEAGLEEGARNGVTGTPAFFINGRRLVGAQPFESFSAVIEDELERAARRVASAR
jgi:protein-disulfide isomerase